jgi:uncharacterized protein (TIGR02145 family)
MKTNILLSLLMFATVSVNSQEYKIWFAGAGASYTVDSVHVENLDKETGLTVKGTDTLFLSGSVGIIPLSEPNPNALQVYPNPMTDHATVDFEVIASGITIIEIYNISGKLVTRVQYFLQSGRCILSISGLSFGVNILKVRSESYCYTAKLICNSTISDRININRVSNTLKSTDPRNSNRLKSQAGLQYNDGDQLLFTCYSGTYSAVIPLVPIQDILITANFIDCIDGNGKSYGTLTINGSGAKGKDAEHTQVWMAQNLDVGTMIEGSQNQTNNSILEKYCYENDTSNCILHGGLYQWDEAMQYITTEGAQGICPPGWHIPTDLEWCTFQTIIDPATDCPNNWDGYDSGIKTRSSTGWDVGNGTNSSGFTAIPTALRDLNGTFPNYIGCATWWWSSTLISGTDVSARQIYCTSGSISRESDNRENGFSVRCISDFNLPSVTTSIITNITVSSATGGGNVVSDGGTTVIAKGVCWSTSPNPTLMDGHSADGSGTGIFVSILTGLDIYTLYYVRAYASNSYGTAYGNEVTFVTNSTTLSLPTVTTAAVSNISQTNASCGGDVLSDGGATVITRGVCWGISQSPTLEDSVTIDGSGNGNFVSNMTGLDTNTNYFVRAYATNNVGTGYGNNIVFSTLPSYSPYPCSGITTVIYQGQTYNTVEIGYQCWFKENLNVGGRINGAQGQTNNNIIEKYCYNDDESNCNIYGGLYQWDEAMQYVITEGAQGICPTGWHFATEPEWATLAFYLGGFQIAGGKMKSSNTGWSSGCNGSNSSGFSALPGGYYNGTQYLGSGGGSSFSTSTPWDIGLARGFGIGCGDELAPGTSYIIEASSVRCIKD